MIRPDIEIEELVRNYPFSVRYLMEHGIKCIACGEPIWGTLAESAKEKGYNDRDIQRFVDEMSAMAIKQGNAPDYNNLPSIGTDNLPL